MRAPTVALLLSLGVAPVRAQTPEQAVRATVQEALEGLARRDTALLRQLFDSTAQLVIVSYRGDSTFPVVIPIRAITVSLGSPGPRRREELRGETVSVLGDLATVSGEYVFYFDDVLHHCGAAMYDLVRVQSRWRIVQIRQTDRRTGLSAVARRLTRVCSWRARDQGKKLV